MKPLLQHLENESLLLLYMCGEMPLDDRAELELMLKRDGGLRAQLETLCAAELASFGALSQLDASEPLRAVEPVIRQVSRSMQQWQIDCLSRPPKVAASRSKMPIWAWSIGSAVAALMVLCVWWGFQNNPVASTQPDPGSQRLDELESVVSEDFARE
jgi:anti-sigma-K factor RskA